MTKESTADCWKLGEPSKNKYGKVGILKSKLLAATTHITVTGKNMQINGATYCGLARLLIIQNYCIFWKGN